MWRTEMPKSVISTSLRVTPATPAALYLAGIGAAASCPWMAGSTGAADAADGGFGDAADVCCEEADICGAAFPCDPPPRCTARRGGGLGRRCSRGVSVDAGVWPFAPAPQGGGSGLSWACAAGDGLGTTALRHFECGARPHASSALLSGASLERSSGGRLSRRPFFHDEVWRGEQIRQSRGRLRASSWGFRSAFGRGAEHAKRRMGRP
jgi:hypothetical protein